MSNTPNVVVHITLLYITVIWYFLIFSVVGTACHSTVHPLLIIINKDDHL